MLSTLLLVTNIDAEAAHHLSTANWPYLTRLQIDSNMYKLPGVQSLTAASVQKLAQGQWPLLEVLDLRCEDLDQCAIGHLVQGCWPMLRRLTLNSKCMTEAVCGMLSIVDILDQLQAMQCEMTKPGFGGHFQLKRLSSTIGHSYSMFVSSVDKLHACIYGNTICILPIGDVYPRLLIMGVVKGYGRCFHGNFRAHMRIPDVTIGACLYMHIWHIYGTRTHLPPNGKVQCTL